VRGQISQRPEGVTHLNERPVSQGRVNPAPT
jgi:hypothetical protein